MATVYLARDDRHDRPVAVKVLAPELAVALGAERFLREIEIVARLNHPHILPLHDSGHAAGVLYYVMPYVEGESLRERLRREPQLPIDEALRIADEVAEALDHAHQLGIIHRDVKPENVLLSGGHALLADFGIARALGSAPRENLTETGLPMGTVAYMSPEQATGSKTVDGRSDLYSLGCVLYEMLAGEPPYMGGSAEAILAKRLSEPVPRLRTLRGTVPEGVEQVITRSLARSPADRFATAGDFCLALSEPHRWIPPRVALGRRLTARARLLWMGAGALVLAMLVAAIALLPKRGTPLEVDGAAYKQFLAANVPRYDLDRNRPREALKILESIEPANFPDGPVDYWWQVAQSYHLLGDHQRELDAAQRARRSDPQDMMALQTEVVALASLGRADDVDARIVERLDHPRQLLFPIDTPGLLMTRAGLELRAHGHPGAARKLFERAVAWQRANPPTDPQARDYKGEVARALYWSERWDEARALRESLVVRDSGDVLSRAALGAIAAREGDRQTAKSIEAWLASPSGSGQHDENPYFRACIMALLGDRDRALGLLQQALREGMPFVTVDHYNWLEVDPNLDSLRDDPAFKELIRPKG
jgi:tetratricopeptide (TPR) repeat protein